MLTARACVIPASLRLERALPAAFTMRCLGVVFCTLLLLAGSGCGGGELKPVELRALVSSRHVEVYLHESGNTCFESGEFHQQPGCHSRTWDLFSAGPHCPFNTTCATKIRLESGDEVLESSDHELEGTYATYAEFDLMAPLSADARLIIEGCGSPASFALRTPPDAVAPTYSEAGQTIGVHANRDTLGVFGSAGSVPPSVQGFYSWCDAAGDAISLPTSADFPAYVVSAFAYDAPVTVNTREVHAKLYPAAWVHGGLLEGVDPGGNLDLAKSAAMLSTLYQSCADYCTAWDGACGVDATDVSDCAVNCVVSGELFPSCRDQYRARLSCLTALPECSSGDSPACDAEATAYQDCTR